MATRASAYLALALAVTGGLGALVVVTPTAQATVASDFSFIVRALDGNSNARPYGQAITTDTWIAVACKGDDLDFYKTTNAGVTWSKSAIANTGNNNLTNCRLAVRDSDSYSVMAYSSPGTYAPSARRIRIYDSDNGGASWANGYDFGRNANGTARGNAMDINYDSAGVGFACVYGRDSSGNLHTARRSGDVWLTHTTFTNEAAFCSIASNSTNVLLATGVSGNKMQYRLSTNSASSFATSHSGPIIGVCLTANAGAGNAIVSNLQWITGFTNQGCENASGGAMMFERTANGGSSYSSGNVYAGDTHTASGYYVEAANAENYVAAFRTDGGTDKLRIGLSTNAGATWTTNAVAGVGGSVTLGNMDLRPGKGGPLVFYTQTGVTPNRIDVAVGDGPTLMGALVGTGNFIFCSALGSSRGGYDFWEDVERISKFHLSQIDTGYLLTGTSDNFAYLGKSWGGVGGTAIGTQAVEVFFTIEADTEATSSVFRAAFSGVPATGDAGAPTLDKGNGVTTGDFSEHVEVEFKEVDNDWSVRLFYVDGGTSRTQLGPAWVGGSPNSARGYRFVLDSRTTSNYVGVQDVAGNWLEVGGVEMKMTLPAGLTSENWFSQWFIGYGTNSFFGASTRLSDGMNLSTCIRDKAGVIASDTNGCFVNGDCGRIVGDGTGPGGFPGTDPDADDEDADGVPDAPAPKGVIGEALPFLSTNKVAYYALMFFFIILCMGVAWKFSRGHPAIVGAAGFAALVLSVPMFALPVGIPILIGAVVVAGGATATVRRMRGG